MSRYNYVYIYKIIYFNIFTTIFNMRHLITHRCVLLLEIACLSCSLYSERNFTSLRRGSDILFILYFLLARIDPCIHSSVNSQFY